MAVASHFSNLAPELRNQIWRESLPARVGPFLYFYKEDCWHPRELDDDINSFELEWRYDMLNDIQFEIPLVFVNREARGIALDWMHQQGVQKRYDKDTQTLTFVRPFYPKRDALYVPFEKWIAFLCEPVDRSFEEDMIGRIYGTSTALYRLAVPEELLRSETDGTSLDDLFQYFYNVELLLIIVGSQPDMQSRWEFERAPGGAFFWDQDRRCFDFRDGERVGNESLYKLIEEAVDQRLNEALPKDFIRNFEIRLAYAVKK